MIGRVLFDFLSAVFNRARGNQFFGLTTSTAESRIMASLGIATLTLMLALFHRTPDESTVLLFTWTWASILFWSVFAWDCYWEAAIGNEVGSKGWPPIDWIIDKIWPMPAPGGKRRLWGLLTMTLRQLLIIPCIVGIAYLSHHPDHAIFSLGGFLMGLPYYISGYLLPASKPTLRRYVIALPELANGLIIAEMIRGVVL